MHDRRRDQFDHFAPRTTRRFIEFSSEHLSPDVLHRRLEGAKVVRAKAVEVAVYATEAVEVRNGGDVQSVEVVDHRADGAHEPASVATEEDVPTHRLEVVEVIEGRERAAYLRIQLEYSHEDANAQFLLGVAVEWVGELFPRGVY